MPIKEGARRNGRTQTSRNQLEDEEAPKGVAPLPPTAHWVGDKWIVKVANDLAWVS